MIRSLILLISCLSFSFVAHADTKITSNSTTSSTDKAATNLKAGNTFLEENKKKPGVVSLKSGLQYKILQEGKGTPPSSTDMVTVKYKGSLIDGTVFENPNTWVTFPVNQVIPGWSEALQLMKPGAKWIIYVPSQLAYGAKGAGNVIGPNQTLIFEIELIDKDADLDEEFKEKGAEMWNDAKPLTP